jgi:hypothetical protein
MVQGIPLEGLPLELSFALKMTPFKGGEERLVPVVKGLGIAKDYWSKEQKQEWDRYRKLG